ncbi:Amino acid adenylation domain-containing protein OS=Streptomyces alboniger OX=132473 GN=CP975_32020 PE=4 SV=1 [Streptomyces alboniger]
MAEHLALRACFRPVSGAQMVQVVVRDVTVPWTEADVSGLGDTETRTRLRELAEGELAHRFDLAAAPLLRLLLVRLGEDRHHLVMTLHHILMDGWSMPVLLGELSQVYEAGGDASALRRAASYGDYVAWVARQDKEAARAAWRTELAGADDRRWWCPRTRRGCPRSPNTSSPSCRTTSREVWRRWPAARAANWPQHGFQAAWAPRRGASRRRHHAVFGSTTAGLPADGLVDGGGRSSGTGTA